MGETKMKNKKALLAANDFVFNILDKNELIAIQNAESFIHANIECHESKTEFIRDRTLVGFYIFPRISAWVKPPGIKNIQNLKLELFINMKCDLFEQVDLIKNELKIWQDFSNSELTKP